MTSRDDVEVDFSQSPRVVTVLEPATEYSMQDLVDTERLLEGSFRGMSEDKLLNASAYSYKFRAPGISKFNHFKHYFHFSN